MTVRSWSWGDDPSSLGRTLARGGILAFPTESSYALGVDPRCRAAVETVAAIKGRTAPQPLPVVVANVAQACALGIHPKAPGLEAVAALWPAALSLIVPLERPLAAAEPTSGLAVRVPDHPRMRALLERLGFGLTATSANRRGRQPITDPERLGPLLESYEAWIIEDGLLPGGAPSTLVRWHGDGFDLLRSGRYPFALVSEGARGERVRTQ